MDKLKLLLLSPIFLVLWAIRFLVELPFWLLGWILVYVLIKLKAYEVRASRWYVENDDETTPRQILAWKGGWLTWLWGNEEDGVDGKYYRTGWGMQYPLAKRIYLWAAKRNAVSNFRYVPLLNIKIDPTKIKGYGNSKHPLRSLKKFRSEGGTKGPAFWSFTTHGLYSGLWIVVPSGPKTYHRLRFGWKLIPLDAETPLEGFVNTSRWPRCGFGLQFTWNRQDDFSGGIE